MNQPGPKGSNRPLAVPRQGDGYEVVYGGDEDVDIELDDDDIQLETKNLRTKGIRKAKIVTAQVPRGPKQATVKTKLSALKAKTEKVKRQTAKKRTNSVIPPKR